MRIDLDIDLGYGDTVIIKDNLTLKQNLIIAIKEKLEETKEVLQPTVYSILMPKGIDDTPDKNIKRLADREELWELLRSLIPLEDIVELKLTHG